MSPFAQEIQELVEPPLWAEAPTARRDQVRSRWPVYGDDEIAAVVEVLRSGRVNALQHGDRCRAFESAMSAHCGVPYAMALANGTLALELALRALGIGPGDEVVVTPRSFVASAACVVACGATPVFADVDPNSQNITADSIARVLTSRTRAVIPVHLAGWPCAMDEIMTLAHAYDLKVIEDCAQAIGATYMGRPVGSFGDAAAFSFCTDKIVSTGGEGGMLLLRDRDAWNRAWSYKDHGKDCARVSAPSTGLVFRWLHDSFGSNYRMTEMQAAIGLVQLGKLPSWIAARRRNAAILNDALAGLASVRLTLPDETIGHVYYKHYAFVRPEWLGESWNRDRIVAEIAAAGVPCFGGTCSEIYRERAFVLAGLGPADTLPAAAALGASSLMFPVDPTLGPDDMRATAAAAIEVFAAAS